MELTDPIVFEPLFMERVWGGRRLESLYGKHLPSGTRIGESWELVDREEAQSVVHSGLLQGSTLNELWTQNRTEIFGADLPDADRFPLLVKLLDAQERLSLQVHPPASVADRFGGQPKTEMWYVLNALLNSDLYAGLKAGATQETFEKALHAGKVAEQIHEMPVATGDAIFIPSGRIHAIGAGNLIAEVQQNSDTTYRVFDWNRIGFDGRPRDLHIKESLASIDFNDVEPDKIALQDGELIVHCEYFRVERWQLTSASRNCGTTERFAIFGVLEGTVRCGSLDFTPGCFFLVPPAMAGATVTAVSEKAAVLRTTIP